VVEVVGGVAIFVGNKLVYVDKKIFCVVVIKEHIAQ
jgi:hypothetical protein